MFFFFPLLSTWVTWIWVNNALYSESSLHFPAGNHSECLSAVWFVFQADWMRRRVLSLLGQTLPCRMVSELCHSCWQDSWALLHLWYLLRRVSKEGEREREKRQRQRERERARERGVCVCVWKRDRDCHKIDRQTWGRGEGGWLDLAGVNARWLKWWKQQCWCYNVLVCWIGSLPLL